MGGGSSGSWSERRITSSKNSTLDVEFTGEGGGGISSMNSTLGAGLKGEEGLERSSGTGEYEGEGKSTGSSGTGEYEGEGRSTGSSRIGEYGGVSGAILYVSREEIEGAGDGEDEEGEGGSRSSGISGGISKDGAHPGAGSWRKFSRSLILRIAQRHSRITTCLPKYSRRRFGRWRWGRDFCGM